MVCRDRKSEFDLGQGFTQEQWDRTKPEETDEEHSRKMNLGGSLIMKAATIQLETLTCPSCIAKIEGALKNLNGVDQESMKVMFNSSKVKLNFDKDAVSIDDIENAITKMGYEVEKSSVR